jgi:antitoxin component of MazEF toxin-antitoxin module
MPYTTKVRRIGNSRGILFPKVVLQESGITGEVDITVKKNVILISPAKTKVKKKWSSFKKVKRTKSDFVVNRFDVSDWTW